MSASDAAKLGVRPEIAEAAQNAVQPGESVLTRIVRRTRQDLAQRMDANPLAMLRSQCSPCTRDLAAELQKGHPAFIMECKKASPSRGLIREDFNPAEIAQAYEPYAAGISVLTDQPFFEGEHRFLTEVSDAVDRPVLCKDFVVDPYQVWEARTHGAHAVLLMLSVLDDQDWQQCFDVVKELGMTALTEVHDEAELQRALALGAPVIGVNNRNLKTLKVDLGVTERLATQVPEDRVLVCESGIRDHTDVRRLRETVDAFLVGSSLMEKADIGQAARQLTHGTVKVCGLTRPRDAQAALRAGASWGGLIFAEESPRSVTPEQARTVIEAEPALRWVGVFVNEDPEQVATLAADLGLSVVQLHGEESPEMVQQLRDCLGGASGRGTGGPASGGRAEGTEGVEIWKALPVGDSVPDLEAHGADRVLLDTRSGEKRGGTGRRFDWGLLEQLTRKQRERIVLAGGLAPENVAEAQTVGCYAVDVNSGVEEAPGIKSGERLQELQTALRGRSRRGARNAR